MVCPRNQVMVPFQNYMTRSGVERLMEDNTQTSVEVSMRRTVTRIVEKGIEDALTVGFDEQK